jgi:hypothetical protein
MRRLPSIDDGEAHGSRSRIVRACADLADIKPVLRPR